MIDEYYYDFDDDTPGDIVEALNEDKSIILYDLNSDGSGIMIKIDYLGLHIKKVKNDDINGSITKRVGN